MAEDLTSAVFLKALRWLQKDRRSESMKGWLYTTARSVIADYWREQGQLTLLPLSAAEEMPALAGVQMQSLHERLQRLLDSLSERDRVILILRYLQRYSAAEIGQALGLSANHVRVSLDQLIDVLCHGLNALADDTERLCSLTTPSQDYPLECGMV